MEAIVIAQRQLEESNPVEAFHVVGDNLDTSSLDPQHYGLDATMKIIAVAEIDDWAGSVYIGGVAQVMPVIDLDNPSTDSE